MVVYMHNYGGMNTHRPGRPQIPEMPKTVRDVQRLLAVDWQAYDSLPVVLRDALKDFNAPTLRAALVKYAYDLCLYEDMAQAQAITTVIENMRRMELEEISMVAERYAHAYNVPYPHVVAGATIQRYDSAVGHRKRRRVAAPLENEVTVDGIHHRFRIGGRRKTHRRRRA